MTSEQNMLKRLRVFAVAAFAFVAGCSSDPSLVAPSVHLAPYDTSRGDVLWATVPLRNETGTTMVDALEVSDAVVAAAAQIEGVRALPLNRTLEAMRGLNMREPQTPEEALELADEMGADAIIVGSIGSWDPYDPPKISLSLALYARPGSLDRSGERSLDVRRLTYQPTDYEFFPGQVAGEPLAVVSKFFDGRNHAVRMAIEEYARGRHDPDSALEPDRYLASMDLFTEFAAWHTVGRLLEHEWLRLARDGGG